MSRKEYLTNDMKELINSGFEALGDWFEAKCNRPDAQSDELKGFFDEPEEAKSDEPDAQGPRQVKVTVDGYTLNGLTIEDQETSASCIEPEKNPSEMPRLWVGCNMHQEPHYYHEQSSDDWVKSNFLEHGYIFVIRDKPPTFDLSELDSIPICKEKDW